MIRRPGRPTRRDLLRARHGKVADLDLNDAAQKGEKALANAIVRADKTLYRVKKGNYMGQNFGLITDVTESEIKLKEIVQDSAGDWAERQSVLPLLEEVGKGDKK